MRICILGAPLPNGNYGVQALAGGRMNLFRHLDPGVALTFICGGSRGSYEFPFVTDEHVVSARVLNYRMSPRARWQEHILVALVAALVWRLVPWARFRNWLVRRLPVLAAFADADLVGDIRGGDSFSDVYGLARLVSGSLPVAIALLLKRRLVLLPQTLGPFRWAPSRWLAAGLVRRASWVLARDQESLEMAVALGGRVHGERTLRFCPDVAFMLASRYPDAALFDPPVPEQGVQALIGFNVSGLLYHGGLNRQNMFSLRDEYHVVARAVLDLLLQDPGRRVLLIPHLTLFKEWKIESDLHASLSLLRDLAPEQRRRVHLLTTECDQHELKGLIGRCEFFVGSRMHACIAALSQRIPTVGIAYTRKFRGVFETVGVGDCALDARELGAVEIVQAVRQHLGRAGEIQRTLRERVPRVQGEIERVFASGLRQLLGQDWAAPAGGRILESTRVKA
jgi:colanic acid/amylovoran biosynthesis protein